MGNIAWYYDSEDLIWRLRKDIKTYFDVPFVPSVARKIVFIAQELGIIDYYLEEPSNDPEDYEEAWERDDAWDEYAASVTEVAELCLEYLEGLDGNKEEH